MRNLLYKKTPISRGLLRSYWIKCILVSTNSVKPLLHTCISYATYSSSVGGGIGMLLNCHMCQLWKKLLKNTLIFWVGAFSDQKNISERRKKVMMRIRISLQKNQNLHIIESIRNLEEILKISCWNSDWATPSSERGKFFIEQFDSDIICLTEGYETLLPHDGYIISSMKIMVINLKKVVKK